MSKQTLTSKSKASCDCQKNCSCNNCQSVLQGSHVCNHGTRPTCACDEQPKKRVCARPLCSLDEPEPIPDPERTQSIMCVLKYDKSCNCKVVTRAVRADVHRYLGMTDRDRLVTHKQD